MIGENGLRDPPGAPAQRTADPGGTDFTSFVLREKDSSMTIPNNRRVLTGRRLGLAVATIAVFAAGCSAEKRVNVSGVVTLNGRPLPEGIVQIHGPGDRISTARIRRDGSFVATDIQPGDTIQVAVVEDPNRVMSRLVAPVEGSVPPAQREPSLPDSAVKIPARYKKIETSGLSYPIGPNTTNIEIKLEE
jgi:hypothetical protein